MSGTYQIHSSQDDAILSSIKNSVRRTASIDRTTDRESTLPESRLAEVDTAVVIVNEDRRRSRDCKNNGSVAVDWTDPTLVIFLRRGDER
ncbi:hypothetical protein AAH991_24200 [Microbispora sp. ZYX-F-249]|uniref:Uncharacterized protein n=1 Tax=Microbispora maris TaxID=3144104 RepID=A0ABV0ASH4_9ACTN